MTDRTDRYPNYVDPDERLDPTVENVPEDVLNQALEIATQYKECPECETKQFIPVVPGHNSNWDCRNCGFEMVVVG